MQCSTFELVSDGSVANSHVEGYLWDRGSMTAPVEAVLVPLGLTSIASSYRAESVAAILNSPLLFQVSWRYRSRPLSL